MAEVTKVDFKNKAIVEKQKETKDGKIRIERMVKTPNTGDYDEDMRQSFVLGVGNGLEVAREIVASLQEFFTAMEKELPKRERGTAKQYHGDIISYMLDNIDNVLDGLDKRVI